MLYWHLDVVTQALDQALSALEAGAAGAAREVEVCLTEVETNLSYLNDILSTGEKRSFSFVNKQLQVVALMETTPLQLHDALSLRNIWP